MIFVGTYTIIVTDSHACQATATTSIASSTAATITIAGPSSYTICNGSPVTFSVSGASSYSWMPSSTLTGSNTQNPTASPGSNTVYTVTGVDINNCSASNTVNIQVNQTPTVTVSGGGGNSQTICSGSSLTGITFSVNPSSSTISWTNTNTAIGLSASGLGNIAGYSSPTGTATTTALITAKATNLSGGCSSNSATALVYTITINPLPGINAPTISPAGCGLSNGTISGITGIYGPGPYTYEWNNTGGFVPSSTLTDGAGTYNIQVKDGTTACIFSQNITIPNSGAPASPALTPSSQTACVGSKVVFAISSPQAGYTYNWTEAGGPGGTGTSYTIASVPASPNPYFLSVTATNNLNCTSSASTASINVVAPPSLSVTANSYTICEGSSQTISVNGAGSYSWLPLANLTGANTSNPTASPSVTTTYTVTGKTSGCPGTSLTITLTVKNAPNAPLLAPSMPNPIAECQGGTALTLSLTATASVTPVWYLGTSKVTTGLVYTPSTATPGTIIYSVIDSSTVTGCTSAMAGNVLTITLTINPTPSSPVLIGPANPLTECHGITPATFSSTTQANIIPVWYSGSTLVHIGQTFSPSTSAVGTTVYMISDSATITGCTNIMAGNVLTVTVSIAPSPTISIAPVGTNGIICSGASAVIIPSGANSYTLNLGNLVGTSFTVSPTVPITYTVNGSASATGCANMASNEGLLSITVNPSTILSISGAMVDSAKCGQATGGVIISPNSISGGATPYTYQWYNASNTVISTSLSLTNEPAGTYSLQVTDANGCNSNTEVFSIPASAPLIVSYILQKDNAAADTWDAYVNYNNGTGPVTYFWNWGDGSSSVTPYPSHTYSVAGTYSICVTIADGSCSSTYCQNDSIYRLSSSNNMVYVNVLHASTGIQQLSITSSQVSVYPNPNSGAFTIETNSTEKQMLQVFDLNGKQVINEWLQGKTTVDATNLPDGVYTISIGAIKKRLVIIR